MGTNLYGRKYNKLQNPILCFFLKINEGKLKQFLNQNKP